MKKLIALALVAVFAVAAQASPRYSFPQGSDGDVAHPLYGGYDATYKSTAAEAMICTGKCLLAGVYFGTGATSSKLTIRDTGTADGGGTNKLPDMYFDTDSGARGNRVPQPIRFTNGISAEISSVAAAEAVTVLYVDLDD
ncbi:MAG: hypothetical protein GTO63_21580 [Anaerolineae bacterium]|nr:hypothetical protein [Anaerolineae bacterium]NIQ80298.1 hypothetical protein [Anaerolineae bacterium]